jgi:phage tail-like protein
VLLMDSNGTRFVLVQRADWTAWADRPPADLVVRDGQLALKPAPETVVTGSSDTAVTARAGAARDAWGRVYAVSADGRSIETVAPDGARAPWWSLDPPQPEVAPGAFGPAEPLRGPQGSLGSLSITASGYLVAALRDGADGALLAIDLWGGAAVRLVLPAGVDPVDLAADGNAIVVVDAASRLWRFAGLLAPAPPRAPASLFHPVGTAAPAPEPAVEAEPIALGAAPIAVDAGADGIVVALAETTSAPARLRWLPRGGAAQDVDLAFTPHDLAVRSGSPGRIYVAGAGGNQAFAFDVTPSGLVASAEQIVLHRWAGQDLLGGDAPAYASGGRYVPLVGAPRHRYPAEGQVTVGPFDLGLPGCVWHRVVIDGCFPPGTGVEIETRAADREADLPGTLWSAEPRFVARPTGPEVPGWDGAEGRLAATLEVLLQRARGRYLQVRVTLRGTGRASPRIDAMRIWAPRFSWVERYLPAVWREDARSASFSDRFLANFEGLITDVEDRIATAERWLDPRTTPPEALPWLAGWFDLLLDASWTDAQRRFFLRHADELFRWRGTARGLRDAVRIALEPDPCDALLTGRGGPDVRIVESFRSRPRTGRPARAGGPTTTSGERWYPEHGAGALNTAWAAAGGSGSFPTSAPAGAASSWEAFARKTLGFVPSGASLPLTRWRDYLKRRYRTFDSWKSAWSPPSSVTTFDQVLFPGVIPTSSAALDDWYDFERIAAPMHLAAHRFVVSLPEPDETALIDDPGLADRLRALIRRVVTVHRPAHTVFDVGFHRTLWTVGRAALGDDTLLGRGSRHARRPRPARLGGEVLGAALLVPAPPLDVADRPVVGRDRVGTFAFRNESRT